MKKLLLSVMLCLMAMCHGGAQNTPPAGTKSISLKVQPNKEFMFGLIATSGHEKAWIELQQQQFTPLTIGDSPTMPTVFKFTSTTGQVKIYGSFHILGCPANGDIIEELDATGYTPLQQLYCNNNNIKKLGLKGCENLMLLSCSENPLDTLDVTSCPQLSDMASFKCGLKGIDLSRNSQLVKLQCPENMISSLDLTACTALQDVSVGKNKLTTIEFPTQNKIKLFYGYQNELQALNLKNLPLLKELDIYSNNIKHLDLSTCSQLQSIDCSENNLSSLDLTACHATLNDLSCSNNQLSTLKVENCTALTYMNASNNHLRELSLKGLKNIEKIYLYSNALDSVAHINNCQALNTLSIADNAMSACRLNALYRALPKRAEQGILEIKGNPEALTSSTALASNKNWALDVEGDGSGCSAGLDNKLVAPTSCSIAGNHVSVTHTSGMVRVYSIKGELVKQAQPCHASQSAHFVLPAGCYFIVTPQWAQKIVVQ